MFERELGSRVRRAMAGAPGWLGLRIILWLSDQATNFKQIANQHLWVKFLTLVIIISANKCQKPTKMVNILIAN